MKPNIEKKTISLNTFFPVNWLKPSEEDNTII